VLPIPSALSTRIRRLGTGFARRLERLERAWARRQCSDPSHLNRTHASVQGVGSFGACTGRITADRAAIQRGMEPILKSAAERAPSQPSAGPLLLLPPPLPPPQLGGGFGGWWLRLSEGLGWDAVGWLRLSGRWRARAGECAYAARAYH
jgi:hypothetical protein